jgi:hypothetical protein
MHGAIITWKNDYRNKTTTGNDVYAQMIDEFGNAKWTFNGEAICVIPGAQSAKKPILNFRGGSIIGWSAAGDTNSAYVKNR